ncbi:hypothetical protein Misp04_13680 [Micromonospora sp. NBRC 101691]|nr:hypothetical protein Misp04_13680 [Micromonospora sp. NBRC 101691]
MPAPGGETRDQAGSVAGQADSVDSRSDLRCETEQGVRSGVRLKTDLNTDANPDPVTGTETGICHRYRHHPERRDEMHEEHRNSLIEEDEKHGTSGRRRCEPQAPKDREHVHCGVANEHADRRTGRPEDG